MTEPSRRDVDAVRPLIRTRQYREFTDEPPSDEQLRALLEVARWTGSSRNTQPWRFILLRDVEAIHRIGFAGMPLTRSLRTATAAIAIVLPVDRDNAIPLAFDEGRAAERILIAASMLGLGAGVAWPIPDVQPMVRDVLGLPPDRMVRTIVSLGRPTEAARAPKNPPGKGRLPLDEVAFEDRWPG